MKTYQVSGEPNKLYFTNYERKDEQIIFDEVITKLKDNPSVVLGKKITCPSEDIYNCSINTNAFTLMYDIDYGASIYCEDSDTINTLKSILNN